MLASDGRRTLVMGIVNVTPDSFSDGGDHAKPEAAVEHALQLVAEGADILDLGGESTRPGSTRVSAQEEWARLEPVLQRLVPQVRVPISIDTYKASVAERSLALGAAIINDVWGGLADPQMLSVVAKANCTYVWMHHREQPADSLAMDTLIEETKTGVQRCLEAGIHQDKLWIDPGIGFGKTFEHNLEVLHGLRRYCDLGWPVLLGASRKGFIGRILGGEPKQRLEGSLAVAAWGVSQGVRAVRVHDVASTVRTCRMMEAMVYGAP